MGKRRSLNANRSNMCNGKTIYTSKKEADGAAGRARRRSGHDNIESFKCKLKSHYHIGHQRPPQERRKLPLADTETATVPRVVERSRIPGVIFDGETTNTRLGRVAGSLWSSIQETEEKVS